MNGMFKVVSHVDLQPMDLNDLDGVEILGARRVCHPRVCIFVVGRPFLPSYLIVVLPL